MRVCPTIGCPQLTEGGRCQDCKSKAAKLRAGHTLHGGGNSPAWRTARARCLRRDRICTCTDERDGHGPRCYAQATVADHWPDSKRDLIAAGVRDVDAQHRLRGVCASCHSKHTAREQPGGWAAR
jgi:5-methylcytosine-specific restriction protein A